MKYTIGIALLVLSLSLFGARIYKKIVFKQNVTGYLKRAADANTIDLAREELKIALRYIEMNNLTNGYTSVIYRTPDEDINFWYRNLQASLLELENLNTERSLERTNMLIKLRETLLDHGKSLKVTVPRGLSVYPHNKMWALLMIVALASMVSGVALLVPKQAKCGKAIAYS